VSWLRPMDRGERWLFALCLLVSLAAHGLAGWLAVPGSPEPQAEGPTGLAERFSRAVNAATDLEARERAQLEQVLAKIEPKRWSRGEMSETLQWAASDLGLAVRDCDVIPSLDPERSQEGRWDIRTRLAWGAERGISDLLALAFLVGEGTLKSDFGSHRFWVELEARDGSGRIAFDTMDCRLYRAGRLPASDLLHRAVWNER
jgi:hypothetical protein